MTKNAANPVPQKVVRLLKSRGVTLLRHHDPILTLKAAWDECTKYSAEARTEAYKFGKERSAHTDKWEEGAARRDEYATAVERVIAGTSATTIEGLIVQVEMLRYDTEQLWGKSSGEAALIQNIAKQLPLLLQANSLPLTKAA